MAPSSANCGLIALRWIIVRDTLWISRSFCSCDDRLLSRCKTAIGPVLGLEKRFDLLLDLLIEKRDFRRERPESSPP